MKTFEEILQREYGTEDEMSYILRRLEPEDISTCVKEYAEQAVKFDRDNLIEIINPRYESETDKIGFVYMDGLKELLTRFIKLP